MKADNLEISQELEQMKEQFRLLSKKVEKQSIISEKQIWSIIRNKMKAYEWWETWVQVFGLLAGCPALVMVAQDCGMASWANIMTVVYGIICLALILFKKRMQDKAVDYNGDLKSFASGVRTVKRMHVCSIAIGLPLALLYITLFCMEFFCVRHASTSDLSNSKIIIFIVLVLATATLALLVDRKKRSLLNDIIAETEE